MYPLLISAASTIASKLIDNWSTAKESKAATSTENFAALLEKNAASASTAASARETQIAALRQKLLDSPEVSTLIATADPSKQPTLTLGTDDNPPSLTGHCCHRTRTRHIDRLLHCHATRNSRADAGEVRRENLRLNALLQ
jgi:hypothetical protein